MFLAAAKSRFTAKPPLRLLALAALLVTVAPGRAVILYGTGDPAANTSAPSGALGGSGWQYEGQFNGFVGTVIANNYFVTAKHIGGTVGDTFSFNGATYATTAVFPDPEGDLQIWRVSGTFPLHAPLYSGAPGTEVNLSLVVFGCGTQRGGPVTVGADSHLGGWLWGNADHLQRWGTNVVSSSEHDPTYGQLLRAAFDASGGANEANLSSGDSGGGVFVFNQSANRWELAGINLAVDGPFSRSSTGASPFDAALFDTTGLFVQDDNNNWVTAPNPSALYATEIAARAGFVNATVMQLTSAVSRKTHGSAGTFNIDLPQSSKPGVECRIQGGLNNHTIVFTFANNVSVMAASVTSGAGSVGSFSVAGNQVTVNLTGVSNAQTITVTLQNVDDRVNVADVSVSMGVVAGDTTADRSVNGGDIGQTKSQSGQAVTTSNFREDVTADGNINGGDVALVKSYSGTGLP